MKRIRSGDTVILIAGKSKGHVGKVLRVRKGDNGDQITIEGANLIKKHVKPNPQLNERGGIITREAAVHVSNVALYNQQSNKADKVGFKYMEKDGKMHKVRYFKSNDEIIDQV